MTTVKRTARLTGVAYLGLAISGMLSYLLVRQQLYVPDDAAETAARLVAHEGLARFGLVLELTVVLTQALAALWFFRLFRRVDAFAAGAITVFGTVNAVMILVATMCSATALDVALADAAAGGTGQAATTQLMHDLNSAAWNAGGLFFGLWLIPMGWLALRSGYMPRPLGWVLIVGGFGYVVSTYLAYVAPGLSGVGYALTVPATIGELWMVGYLLVKGVRSDAAVAEV